MKKENIIKYSALAFGVLAIGIISKPISQARATTINISAPFSKKMAQDAKEILNNVHAQYNKSPYLKINFSLAYKGSNANAFSNEEKGDIWVAPKANQYKILMENNEYISDGKSQWAILKDIEEIQITEIVNSSAGQIAPSNLFSFFQNGFRSKIAKSETVQNKNVWNIELSPEKTNLPYNKVILRVVKNTNEIHDITIFDKNNGQMKYTLNQVDKLSSLNSDLFKFDKNQYKNMEIVDLR